MSNIPVWSKALIATAIVAIIAVVVQNQRHAANEQAWALLASSEIQTGAPEVLEDARERTRGTAAGPHLAWRLAFSLFEAGGAENFERARQVAQETVDQNPDHVVSGQLRNLIAAIDSYEVAPAQDA